MSQTSLSKVATTIRAAERIAIATHISPDPDAIGSALGLTHVLVELGKQVVPLCEDGVPESLEFLPGAERVQRALPDDFTADLIISLDASDTERLGAHARLVLSGERPVVNIDHHVTNLEFGTLNLVDPAMAATSELLVLVIDALDAPLGFDAATCLMAALVGDTRGFSIPGVTPHTLRVGARLVEAGANLSDITDRIMNRRTYDTLRLWELALSHMKLEDGVAWTALTADERRERGLLSVDNHGLSNLLLSARETYISAAFTERTDGLIDISFRAKPGFDVASVALALGGGGHPLAAGCMVEGPLADVVENVVARLKAQVSDRVVEQVSS